MEAAEQNLQEQIKSHNEQLFAVIHALNLPAGSYALFGSAPLGIRGLRQCSDIDLLVTPEVFEQLRDQDGWQLIRRDNGEEHLAREDGVEIFTTWGPGQWDPASLIANAEMIQGMPFVQLEEVVKWKKLLGREKDAKDLALITEYQQKQKETAA